MPSDTLSWRMHAGADQDVARPWEGGLNVVLTNAGAVEAALTSRFGGGAGLKMEGVGAWLDTYGDTLVVYLASDDAAGVGETGAQVEAYGASGSPAHDDLLSDAGYQVLAPSVADPIEGFLLPALDGAGGARGVASATGLARPAGMPPISEDPAAAVVRINAGPAGTESRGYLLGQTGDLNGLVPGTKYSCVWPVWIPANSGLDPGNIKLYARDNLGSTEGVGVVVPGQVSLLEVTRTLDPAATEAYFDLAIEDGTPLATANELLYTSHPTVVAGARPTLIPSTSTAEVTALDEIYTVAVPPSLAPVPLTLQMTLRVKGVEAGTVWMARLGTTGAYFGIQLTAAGGVQVAASNETNTATTSAHAITIDADVEITARWNADNTLDLFVGGLQVVSAAAGPAGGAPATFGNQVMAVGSGGFGGHSDVRVRRVALAQASVSPAVAKAAGTVAV